MYKKKKRRLWPWLLLIVIAVAAGGVGWYQRSHIRPEAQKEEIVLEENQQLINVRITKMLGNEMTGILVSGEEGESEQSEGEQKTWLIPVGTEVETRLGTITTFARLRSGDNIQMLMQTGETEEILKIWITQ